MPNLNTPLTPAIDLHLAIGAAVQGSHPVRATPSLPRPAGSSSLLQSVITGSLAPLVQRLAAGEALAENSLITYGKASFEALFQGEVRDLYRDLQARLESWQRLRILLQVQPPELRHLPWELLYDPWLESWVGSQDRTTIIRYVEAFRSMKAVLPSAAYGIKILVITSQPSDIPALYVDREVAALQEVAASQIRSNLISFDFRPGRVEEILAGLRGEPEVIHFIGHGAIVEGESGIFLLDHRGYAKFANYTFLENQLLLPARDALQRLSLTIFNACDTSASTAESGRDSLAQQWVRWSGSVVAMQHEIEDSASRAFSRALYQNLAQSLPIDQSLHAARQAIRDGSPGNQRDWIAPVLLSNGEGFEITRQLVPFKGPAHYDVADRATFFGRAREASRLSELVAQCPVVVLYGSPTAGKTSLLLAGYSAEATRTRPVVFLPLAEDFETRLRQAILPILLNQGSPVTDTDPTERLLEALPADLVFAFDRAEQISLLGEAVQGLLRTVANWAIRSHQAGGGRRVILATRPGPDGAVPAFFSAYLPDLASASLHLDVLEREAMAEVIQRSCLHSPVRFSPEAITRILNDLNYDDEPNMLTAQITCLALYRRARELGRSEVNPELVSDPALSGVTGILSRDFDLAHRLEQPGYAGGALARQVLVQFLRSTGENARPVALETLLLRLAVPAGEIRQTVDRLEEDGILVYSGQGTYELVHEALARRIAAFAEFDPALRKAEELVQNAGSGLLPVQGEAGGLADLNAARDSGRLRLPADQQRLVVRSALEAGHEVAAWCDFVADPSLRFEILIGPYLSLEARRRTLPILGELSGQPGEIGEQARRRLLGLAESEATLRSEACQVAATRLVPAALAAYFSERKALPEPALETLACLYSRHPFSLAGIESTVRRKLPGILLRQNAPTLLRTAGICALFGAAGFTVAGWINWTTNLLGPGSSPLDWVALLPAGLLVFLLALPGSALPGLGREVFPLLFPGNRKLLALLGVLAGGALGTALSIFLIAGLSLAAFGGFDLRPTLAGLLVGALAVSGWLLATLLEPRKPTWLGPVAGITGSTLLAAAGVILIEQGLDWWPDTTYLLVPKLNRQLWLVGAILGFTTTAGLFISQKNRQKKLA